MGVTGLLPPLTGLKLDLVLSHPGFLFVCLFFWTWRGRSGPRKDFFTACHSAHLSIKHPDGNLQWCLWQPYLCFQCVSLFFFFVFAHNKADKIQLAALLGTLCREGCPGQDCLARRIPEAFCGWQQVHLPVLKEWQHSVCSFWLGLLWSPEIS